MTTTTAHRHRRLGAALTALTASVLLIFAAATANGAGGTSATCTVRFIASITPGFTPVPSTGTLSTRGQTGLMACVGKAGGHRITGPGRMGFEETHTGGTCRGHVGSGPLSVTIPTTGGVKHLEGTLFAQRNGPVVRADVRFPGARFKGVGAAIFRSGTCFVTALREVLVSVTGVLHAS